MSDTLNYYLAHNNQVLELLHKWGGHCQHCGQHFQRRKKATGPTARKFCTNKCRQAAYRLRRN